MPIPALVVEHLQRRSVPYRLHHQRRAQSEGEIVARTDASGVCFGKVIVTIVDGHPVIFVVPAHESLDPGLARAEIGARRLRVATRAERDRYFPGVDSRATPPLRLWDGVTIWMDRALRHEGPFVFQAGTQHDAIEMDFTDWLRITEPQIGRVVRSAAASGNPGPVPPAAGR